jgi:eukaryotic-like serine/threonine-protein kinase
MGEMEKRKLAIRRFFTFVVSALAMVAVALVSAFIAMRFAIHGREEVVPTLAGLSIADATSLARRDGLNLTLENRFYSAGVPPGRILAQDPAPGSRVRRDWPIRITESLGSQAVDVPDLTGASERAATISIRRLSLELGTVAHLAVAGDADVVLAQTPPAHSGGVDGPRVSLLVSDPILPDASASDSSDSNAIASAPAYVMPSLLGLSWSAATARASTAGLRLVADTPAAAPDGAGGDGSAAQTAAQALGQGSLIGQGSPGTVSSDGLVASAPPAQVRPGGVILAQTPQAGRRVAEGGVVHVTLSGVGAAGGAAASGAPQ